VPGKDYRKLKNYALVLSGQEDKLVMPLSEEDPDHLVYYVRNDEMFDKLTAIHSEQTGHPGRNKMMPHVNYAYANIIQKVVSLFLKHCGVCKGKKKVKKRGITVKPILHSTMNARWVHASYPFPPFPYPFLTVPYPYLTILRCQVNRIDFQSHPDGEFRFIMTYQDHLTKFVILRPLERKESIRVAKQLLSIWLLFGAPAILQSDNGREFVAHGIEELKVLFPDLKIIHGRYIWPYPVHLPSSCSPSLTLTLASSQERHATANHKGPLRGLIRRCRTA